MQLLLNKLPIHKIAVAYRRGLKSPIKKTAEKHSVFRYTVNIDIKDFFPSIKPNDLLQAIHDYTNADLFTEDEIRIIINSLFINIYSKIFLAVGHHPRLLLAIL